MPKKSDRTKCCARPARNGYSLETRRVFPLVTGRIIKNDAPVQCVSFLWTQSFTVDNMHSPSSRVATAERKLKLVNDASAKSFSATSVRCGHCDATIELDSEGDYNLSKWEEHKASCPRSARYFFVNKPFVLSWACVSSPDNEQTAMHADGTLASASNDSPSRSEKSENRPPVSVASTEATAVDATTLLGMGKKRARESDEDDSETRPRTRARTDLIPPPSGALDWLLLPFRSFVSGFKKGMAQSSSPSPPPSTESTRT